MKKQRGQNPSGILRASDGQVELAGSETREADVSRHDDLYKGIIRARRKERCRPLHFLRVVMKSAQRKRFERLTPSEVMASC